MSRWQPDARGRLEQAALDLYCERGFEDTTVAEIAARAGLTERTFFRHFADKREVLFGGAVALLELLVDSLSRAADLTAPLDAVAATFEAVTPVFEGRRDYARRRQALILAHPVLRERELIKLASIASALAATLRLRGVPDPAATLTAEAGVAIFKIAFETWVADPHQRDLTHHLRHSLAELKALAVAGPATPAPAAHPSPSAPHGSAGAWPPGPGRRGLAPRAP